MSTLPIVETLRRERRCFTCAALSTDVARLEAADTIEALYEALEMASGAIDSLDEDELGQHPELGHFYRDELLRDLDNALAKARGEQPDA